jgi:hypothetical protein
MAVMKDNDVEKAEGDTRLQPNSRNDEAKMMSRPCELCTSYQRQQIGSAIDTSAEEEVAALIAHSNVVVLKITR